jgi:diketogulonate reductase-like aldo/keto reductase
MEDKTTKFVTRDEAIEGLTARIKELEMIQKKGGMTVPKMRDIARRLGTAKAKLLRLSSPPSKPRKRKSAGAAMATYLEKKAALLRQLGVSNVD